MKPNKNILVVAIIVLIAGAGVMPGISGISDISENIESDTIENRISKNIESDITTTVDTESSDESEPVDENWTLDITIDETVPNGSTIRVFEKIMSRRGLIAYWNFNEGSGNTAYDSSRNNNHATIDGAEWIDGKCKTALEITGTDIIQYIPSSFDDSIDDSMTITAWVYWHGSPLNVDCIIFDARDGGNGFTFTIVDGYLQFYLFLPQGQHQSITSKDRIPVGEWTHVAATLNYHSRKPSLQIFIDGKENVNIPAIGPYCDSFRCAAIGNNRWAPGDGEWATFNGIIDELRIYNRALNRGNIRALYNVHKK